MKRREVENIRQDLSLKASFGDSKEKPIFTGIRTVSKEGKRRTKNVSFPRGVLMGQKFVQSKYPMVRIQVPV